VKKTLLLLTVASLAAGATLLYAAEDHRPYRNMKISECTECHRDADVSPNHRVGWNADHRLLAVKADANCAMCHEQSFCQDCHFGGGIDAGLHVSNDRGANYKPKSHRPPSWRFTPRPRSTIRTPAAVPPRLLLLGVPRAVPAAGPDVPVAQERLVGPDGRAQRRQAFHIPPGLVPDLPSELGSSYPPVVGHPCAGGPQEPSHLPGVPRRRGNVPQMP
jgi:hypothetical protein